MNNPSLCLHLLNSTFIPKFVEVSSIDEVADMINKPHEDYPRRIPNTKEAIQILLKDGVPFIHEGTLHNVHGFIMDDMSFMQRGKYRNCNVSIGNDSPPEFYMVPNVMMDWNMFPVNVDTNMEEWYRKFNLIHPYADGNGRTSGVIFAVMKKIQTGKWFAPLQ